ncbi:MAG: prokaryotic E2 ligase family D protein [Opitutus sp.]|nr:prokaryotic E2 ligase family D protein [Opitutus sp.]
MSVWALRSNYRPELEAPLFHAPILNRYEDGKLCMGDMPIGTDVESWEQSFFGSRFTNPHYQPVGYRQLVRAKRRYSLKRLAPCGYSLEAMLASCTS